MRINYVDLRHLLVIDRHLDSAPAAHMKQKGKHNNNNFNQLRLISETGQTTGEVVPSFLLTELLQGENFTSQLYFLGLLTFAGEEKGEPLLRIPNRVVKEWLYDYLREEHT